MRKIPEQRLWRVLDANFNRAKEGLRVCEDICRFIGDDPALTRRYKRVRHRLTAVIDKLGFGKLLSTRAIERDVGRGSSASELKRKDTRDIYYANAQRAKESLRVLEEFAKLLNPRVSGELKKARYEVYALEQKSIRF